jgi:hypothetical protein
MPHQLLKAEKLGPQRLDGTPTIGRGLFPLLKSVNHLHRCGPAKRASWRGTTFEHATFMPNAMNALQLAEIDHVGKMKGFPLHSSFMQFA